MGRRMSEVRLRQQREKRVNEESVRRKSKIMLGTSNREGNERGGK